jgi:hypothetical protein
LEDDLHHRWKGGHVLKAKIAWQRCRTIGELREALADEFDHPPSLVTFHTAGHEAAAGFEDDRCVNSIDATDATIELMVVCHAAPYEELVARALQNRLRQPRFRILDYEKMEELPRIEEDLGYYKDALRSLDDHTWELLDKLLDPSHALHRQLDDTFAGK